MRTTAYVVIPTYQEAPDVAEIVLAVRRAMTAEDVRAVILSTSCRSPPTGRMTRTTSLVCWLPSGTAAPTSRSAPATSPAATCTAGHTNRALGHGYRVAEVPITVRERARGSSKMTVGIAVEACDASRCCALPATGVGGRPGPGGYRRRARADSDGASTPEALGAKAVTSSTVRKLVSMAGSKPARRHGSWRSALQGER